MKNTNLSRKQIRIIICGLITVIIAVIILGILCWHYGWFIPITPDC